ncbi:MAG: ECF transporter S component [Oscillospiraceae bacterium]|jgi:uncharacterized membrane protein|nr:ECF transporter S component [Oscillospiraceae bacterium]
MKKEKIIYMVKLGLLVALMLVMSVTPIGYLNISVVAITFLCVPIAVGAALLGPSAGAVLGLVFGITSLVQAPSNALFGAVFAAQPMLVAAVCIVPRVVIGPLTAWFTKLALKVDKKRVFAYGAAGLLCSLLNTILFLSGVIFILGKWLQGHEILGGKTVTAFFAGAGLLNGLPEAAACMILTAAICVAVTAAEGGRGKKAPG